jgi:hypothetical protein
MTYLRLNKFRLYFIDSFSAGNWILILGKVLSKLLWSIIAKQISILCNFSKIDMKILLFENPIDFLNNFVKM